MLNRVDKRISFVLKGYTGATRQKDYIKFVDLLLHFSPFLHALSPSFSPIKLHYFTDSLTKSNRQVLESILSIFANIPLSFILILAFRKHYLVRN